MANEYISDLTAATGVSLTDLLEIERTADSTSKNMPLGFMIINGKRAGITGLTGGGATNLDGLVTLNQGTGVLIYINDATEGVGFWELASGTTNESAANGVVRPDDYASSTNEKIWLRRF